MSKIVTPQVKPLSDRKFGLIFAAIFLVIGAWPLLHSADVRMWALVIAAAFTIPALLLPRLLAPLNVLWARFGLFMHKIVNPILMGLIFFVTVLPTGILLKLFGKDPMQRRFDKSASTYWQTRTEQLSKESFDNQF